MREYCLLCIEKISEPFCKLAFCFLVLTCCNLLNAAMINVPKDYYTIQEAIDAAKSDDVIVISEGTYTEDIAINKFGTQNPKFKLAIVQDDRSGKKISVTLRGHVLVYYVGEILFEGIRFIPPIPWFGTGINVPSPSAAKVVLKNCEIRRYYKGIYADSGASLVILNSVISDCYSYGILTQGTPYSKSEKISIFGSVIKNNQTGIRLFCASLPGPLPENAEIGGKSDVLDAVNNTFKKNGTAIEIKPNIGYYSSSADIYYAANNFKKNGVNILYPGIDELPPGVVEGPFNQYDIKKDLTQISS